MSGPPRFDRVVADAHSGYHDESRRHQEPDVLVDDVVTWSMLSPHLMRALMFLVAPTVLVLIWLLLGYLASMSGPDAVGDAITSFVGFLAVVLYAAGVAALFAPAKEPIAEYAQLLEGRGAAARTAYDWVRRAAVARRAPAEVVPSTIAGVPVLLFHQHTERAMLLVQAYGEDLYVGWTMWRSRSSATMLLHFLRDTFGRFGTGPRFSAELRAASTRALRESVHSLSREGVLAAVHAQELEAAGPARAEDPFRTGPEAAAGYGRRDRHAADPGRSAAPYPADPGRSAAPYEAGAYTGPPSGSHAGPHTDPPHAEPHPGPDPAAERPRTGELPRPAPAWGSEDIYTPRHDDRAREPRARDAGWGPPPARD